LKLDLFKDIKNSIQNSGVQSFIKELSEFIGENFSKNDKKSISRKEQSLIQELLAQNKLTTDYRDKMHVERSRILQDYSKQTTDKGEMYYIYNKDDDEIDTYHLCICDQKSSHRVIEVKGSDLPAGAGVDSVLRIRKGEYVLDKVATNEVYQKMEKMVLQLLEEQTQKMEEHRIESHLYEVIEVSSKNLTLLDITKDKNNGECFEELVSKQNFPSVKEGDILKYVNGEYINTEE